MISIIRGKYSQLSQVPSRVHRPYDDHVARCSSQRVDEGAENRHSHVGGETAAAVCGVRTLAQPHGPAAACWEGGGHTAAVVEDLGKR